MLEERGFSFLILLSKTQGELGAARILPKRGERAEGREKEKTERQAEGKSMWTSREQPLWDSAH